LDDVMPTKEIRGLLSQVADKAVLATVAESLADLGDGIDFRQYLHQGIGDEIGPSVPATIADVFQGQTFIVTEAEAPANCRDARSKFPLRASDVGIGKLLDGRNLPKEEQTGLQLLLDPLEAADISASEVAGVISRYIEVRELGRGQELLDRTTADPVAARETAEDARAATLEFIESLSCLALGLGE
jgi:hypothetical protein